MGHASLRLEPARVWSCCPAGELQGVWTCPGAHGRPLGTINRLRPKWWCTGPRRHSQGADHTGLCECGSWARRVEGSTTRTEHEQAAPYTVRSCVLDLGSEGSQLCVVFSGPGVERGVGGAGRAGTSADGAQTGSRGPRWAPVRCSSRTSELRWLYSRCVNVPCPVKVVRKEPCGEGARVAEVDAGVVMTEGT